MNMILNSLALSVLEGKGGKFQLKPEFQELKLTGPQFTAMHPEQRAAHWRQLALEPPEEAVPEGLAEIRLKIPNVSSAEVHDLRTRTAVRSHYIHARHSCMVGQYPYFWSGLIKADNDVRDRLSGAQINHANQQLAFFVDREPLM